MHTLTRTLDKVARRLSESRTSARTSVRRLGCGLLAGSALAILFSGLDAAPVEAQVRVRAFGGTGRRSRPIRDGLPTAANGVVDRGFTFCRLMYRSVTSEQRGQGWSTDYDDGEYNFVTRFEELTTSRPAVWADGLPGYAVVQATQRELFECPFLFMSDAGTVGFSPEEVESLADYFAKGGLLWADDFWGTRAWARFEAEVTRALPGRSFVDIGPDHMIMQALYQIDEVPQVPSIQFWRQAGYRGETSEMGPESATPHLRAIFDDEGRAMVIATHNTDIADGWEREGEDYDFFLNFSPQSYALAVNIVLYALSH